MKLQYLIVLSAALCMSACSGERHSHEHEHEHEHEEGHVHGGHSHEGHHHEDGDEDEADEHKHSAGEIVLHRHEAERFGVVFDTVRAGDFHEVVRAAGRVVRGSADDAVVAAPTAGIVHFSRGVEPGRELARGAAVATLSAAEISGGDANAVARAELAAAQRELERVKGLYKERLATLGELNAAQDAYSRTKAAYSPRASSGVAPAPISGTVTALLAKEGQYVSTGEAIAAMSKGDGSVLRVELPMRYYSSAKDFTDLYADFAGGEGFRVSERGGRRLGEMPAGESAGTGGYTPVYFTVASGAPAGAAFTAYLTGKERHDVITVPVTALSEQQGAFYVYILLDDEHYRKMPVRTGASDGQRVEIVGGLEPGMVYASTAVSAVRLAETSAVAPEGHTHNH